MAGSEGRGGDRWRWAGGASCGGHHHRRELRGRGHCWAGAVGPLGAVPLGERAGEGFIKLSFLGSPPLILFFLLFFPRVEKMGVFFSPQILGPFFPSGLFFWESFFGPFSFGKTPFWAIFTKKNPIFTKKNLIFTKKNPIFGLFSWKKPDFWAFFKGKTPHF